MFLNLQQHLIFVKTLNSKTNLILNYQFRKIIINPNQINFIIMFYNDKTIYRFDLLNIGNTSSRFYVILIF